MPRISAAKALMANNTRKIPKQTERLFFISHHLLGPMVAEQNRVYKNK
jgi:hypothetical protein